eukprot:TRINITY_DN11202_c0_g1_i15.p2 TRINITY_DN11202_c0_g1~~TRINITY_DN11202_c0_g1_i15.p2  ORF type:complete len:171 (+),score=19.70 TRINITY_DN11202_c0_g1_i15:648-1160(+)
MFDHFLSIKSICTLDGSFPLQLVVEVLNDIERRPEWEKQFLEAEVLRRHSEAFFTYRILFLTPWIENRDFVEKVVIFQVDDAYYMYSSSIPDSYCPARPKCTRGYNVFSVTRIQRVGNKIVVANANQRDIRAGFTGFVTLGMIGGKTADSITDHRNGLIKRIRFLMDAKK